MTETKDISAKALETQTIGDVVANDYRTSAVFEKYGIDFCCGGKIPVTEVCRERGINLQELQRELQHAMAEPMDQKQNFGAMELPELIDHIVSTHHAYLKEYSGSITAYANKIAEVHGENHPEVIKISRIFSKIAEDMAAHLREEEEVLFPAIKRVAGHKGEGVPTKDIEALRKTLATLTDDHDAIGEAVHTIRDLANNYTIPDDVCNTFMVTYRKLKEFEDDLHKHVHLENNILFPKASKL